MRLKEMNKDEMPREKLIEKGPGALSNTELVAILLRVGTEGMNVLDVARELLKRGDNKLNTVATMPQEMLCGIPGIGKSKAVTLAAAFELGRRISVERIVDTDTKISSPEIVYRIMLPEMRGLQHEECWAIYLNRANHILGKEKLTSGGTDSTIFDIKFIAKRALERLASGVIIIHNHPSGSALPSAADISQTRSLKKALDTFDISLIDHVIVAQNSYYSFNDEELMDFDKVKRRK